MSENALIDHRSKLLATVALTRRLNIDVLPIGNKDEMGLDLMCSVRTGDNDRVKGFLPFGVIVQGTARELKTEEDAARHVRSNKSKIFKRQRFYMPVIVLL